MNMNPKHWYRVRINFFVSPYHNSGGVCCMAGKTMMSGGFHVVFIIRPTAGAEPYFFSREHCYKNKMFYLQLGRTNSFITGNTEVEKAWVSILTGWL